MAKRTQHIKVLKVSPQKKVEQDDQLAVEEPLEIQLVYGSFENRLQKSISITMRTPGNDFELAAGFLFTEGIIQSPHQIKEITHPKQWHPDGKENVVQVALAEDVELDLKKLERHFYTTSSCGVCGKASIDAIKVIQQSKLPKNQPVFNEKKIHKFPKVLLKEQSVFANTGGLHAAALFDNSGKLHLLREDVGRHNAVDKLIGAAFSNHMLPLNDFLIMVSGRASFELVQKSVMAGIPILAAVGAPSSLAIDLAKESMMTVLGFVRESRFNIYSHPERIEIQHP